MSTVLGNTLDLDDYDFQVAPFLEFSRSSRVACFENVLVCVDPITSFVSDIFVWVRLNAQCAFCYKLYRLPLDLSDWAIRSCKLKLFPNLLDYGLLDNNQKFLEFKYNKDEVISDNNHPIIPDSLVWGENLLIAMESLQFRYTGTKPRNLLSYIHNISEDCKTINLYNERKSDFPISELIRCVHDLFENTRSLFMLYYDIPSKDCRDKFNFSDNIYRSNISCYFLSRFDENSELSYRAFSDLRAVFSEHTGDLSILTSKSKSSTIKVVSNQYILDFERSSDIKSYSELDKLWHSTYLENKDRFLNCDYQPTDYAILSDFPNIVVANKNSLVTYAIVFIKRITNVINSEN